MDWGQHCQTLGVLGAVSQASVSLSAQWVMPKTKKPLQLRVVFSEILEAHSPLSLSPPAGFSGFRAPGSSLGGGGGSQGKPRAWPAASACLQRVRALLRAHKAPGADVRAPLGAAGPQCRRSRAVLPPRPGSQPGASRQPSSPAKPARSPARARARPTCKLVPPAQPSPGSPRPSRLSPAMGKRACWPSATATATASSPRPPTPRWGLLGHLRHEARVGVRRVEVGGARCRCPKRPGARPCLILGASAPWLHTGCTPGKRLARGKSGTPGRVAERADGASRAPASSFIFRGW